jgi:hypothetical protein
MTMQPDSLSRRLAWFPATLATHPDWTPVWMRNQLPVNYSGRASRAFSQHLLHKTGGLSLPIDAHWKWLALDSNKIDDIAIRLVVTCLRSYLQKTVLRTEVRTLRNWLGRENYDYGIHMDSAWDRLANVFPRSLLVDLPLAPAANVGRGMLLAHAVNKSAAHALRMRWKYPADTSQWATEVSVTPDMDELLAQWIDAQHLELAE